MNSNKYKQFKLEYCDWKGNGQIIFLFAESLEDAQETASKMQGLHEINRITPID